MVSRLDAMVSRLDAMVSRLDAMVSRLDAMVSRLDSMVSRLDSVESPRDPMSAPSQHALYPAGPWALGVLHRKTRNPAPKVGAGFRGSGSVYWIVSRCTLWRSPMVTSTMYTPLARLLPNASTVLTCVAPSVPITLAKTRLPNTS